MSECVDYWMSQGKTEQQAEAICAAYQAVPGDPSLHMNDGDQMCVDSWMGQGKTREEAEAICASNADDADLLLQFLREQQLHGEAPLDSSQPENDVLLSENQQIMEAGGLIAQRPGGQLLYGSFGEDGSFRIGVEALIEGHPVTIYGSVGGVPGASGAMQSTAARWITQGQDGDTPTGVEMIGLHSDPRVQYRDQDGNIYNGQGEQLFCPPPSDQSRWLFWNEYFPTTQPVYGSDLVTKAEIVNIFDGTISSTNHPDLNLMARSYFRENEYVCAYSFQQLVGDWPYEEYPSLPQFIEEPDLPTPGEFIEFLGTLGSIVYEPVDWVMSMKDLAEDPSWENLGFFATGFILGPNVFRGAGKALRRIPGVNKIDEGLVWLKNLASKGDNVARGVLRESQEELIGELHKIHEATAQFDPRTGERLRSTGIPFTEDDIVGVTRLQDSEDIRNLGIIRPDIRAELGDNAAIVYLETGSERGGLVHIMEEHSKEFAGWGLEQADEVSTFIVDTIQSSKAVGYTGTQGNILVYAVEISGEQHYLGVSLSDSGFIISARPVKIGDFNPF